MPERHVHCLIMIIRPWEGPSHTHFAFDKEMHGRPREYKKKLEDPVFQEGYKKKVDAIRKGTALILECRKLKRFDSVALDASAKLLKVVPEIYTIWNFRREALSSVFEAATCTSSPTSSVDEQSDLLAAAKKASDGELALTQACLMENPKSYSTWHHRKWVVAKGLCDLNAELKLVTRALDEDSRNFHAWSYRKLIVRLMGRGDEQELAYSEDKIAQDFSNYSAFHYRTTLLPRMGDVEGQGARAGLIPASVLDEEFDMVHQAFATDCKDQSPWMYYRWLLGQCQAQLEASRGKGGQAVEEEEKEAKRYLESVYEREKGRMREDHLTAEPDAKWPLLTLAVLSEGLHRLQQGQEGSGGEGGEGEGPASAPGGVCSESREIYERLLVLDPMRSGFYKDALEGKASLIIKR